MRADRLDIAPEHSPVAEIWTPSWRSVMQPQHIPAPAVWQRGSSHRVYIDFSPTRSMRSAICDQRPWRSAALCGAIQGAYIICSSVLLREFERRGAIQAVRSPPLRLDVVRNNLCSEWVRAALCLGPVMQPPQRGRSSSGWPNIAVNPTAIKCPRADCQRNRSGLVHPFAEIHRHPVAAGPAGRELISRTGRSRIARTMRPLRTWPARRMFGYSRSKQDGL